jgi:plasmid segregation protein ParM
MEPVVRAVDVGRGNTKFVTGTKNGELRCEMFPSQAHPSEAALEPEAWGARRKTVGITVGGLVYEVGPDVHLAADVFNANVLQHDRYCETPEYLALLLGALHYMQVDHIDLLVVGLPVATYKIKPLVGALERRLTGEHELAKGRRVKVLRAKALAQPAGALMHYGLMQSRVAQLRKERSLIVDPGRRTFDWLVTQGMQQIDKRSHSVPRGMHDVLQTIIEGISRSTSSHYRDYDTVDFALRTGKRPVVFQHEYDLTRHLPLAKKIPEQAVAEMMHYVGDASDIRNIILVGGGAFFYRAALKAAFPNHAIHELKDPIFANVKGFQQAGLELARSLLGAGSATNSPVADAATPDGGIDD